MIKLKKYFSFIIISFKNGTFYKLDYFAGLVNIFFMIVINIVLWETLYKNHSMGNTIQHRMMITYLILSIVFQALFMMDEFFIDSKMRDGTVIHYLIKPVSFRLYIFFNAIGKMIFSLVMLFIPALIVINFIFPMIPPQSIQSLLFFIPTIMLGYLLLYNFNFIFWTLSFEIMTSWGIITFKNAFIVVLSGALIPLWFMPEEVANVVRLLPFQSIYYFPLSVYLGVIPEQKIYTGILIQVIWIFVFALLGHLSWKRTVKDIVVQGG